MSLDKKKKEAFVRSKRLRTDEALEEYKETRKELRVRRPKMGHKKSYANRIKENSKAFYTYVKSKRVARERIGPLKGGNPCMEPEEMGEILNEYFARE